MINRIENCIETSMKNFEKILNDDALLLIIEQVTSLMIEAFNNDHKVLLCGNGGSASDAQHIAAELSGRFYIDRRPLYAEALHVNSSFMTAVANDYGYEETYARMVEATGRKGDILLGLSTSGDSSNVIKAIQKARRIGMKTVGFTGENGGRMNNSCDIVIHIPSKDTPRIQEAHILIGHIVCQLVEEELFQ